MVIRDNPLSDDFDDPATASDVAIEDADFLPNAEDWVVVESLRSARENALENDPEDERFIALMLGGDAFD